MGWPCEVLLIQHASSLYQKLKRDKKASPLYREFLEAIRSKADREEILRLGALVMAEFRIDMPNSEIPLTAEAREEEMLPAGRGMAESLALPDVVYASPYRRCGDTLQGLGEAWPALRGVEVRADKRLREQEHGLADGYYDAPFFYFLHPEEGKKRRAEGLYHYRLPGGGENMDDMRDRLRDWMQDVCREFAGRRVMVFLHWRVLLALRLEWERLTDHDFHRLDSDKQMQPVPCGVTRYVGTEAGFVLDFYNRRLY